MCGVIPSVRDVAGLLLIQRVVMLKSPLIELELSVSVVRPPLARAPLGVCPVYEV